MNAVYRVELQNGRRDPILFDPVFLHVRSIEFFNVSYRQFTRLNRPERFNARTTEAL